MSFGCLLNLSEKEWFEIEDLLTAARVQANQLVKDLKKLERIIDAMRVLDNEGIL